MSIRGSKFEAAADFPDNYWCKFGTQSIQATFDKTTGLIECFSPPLQKNGSVEMEVNLQSKNPKLQPSTLNPQPSTLNPQPNPQKT